MDVRCRKERRRMTNVLANAWDDSDSSGYGQVVDLIPLHNADGARARAVTPGTVAYCEEKPPLSDLIGRQRLSGNLTCYAEAPQHFKKKAQIHETSPFFIPSLVCSGPTHMSSSYPSISLRPSTLFATQRCCLRCQSWIYRRTCTTGWCRSSVITPTGPCTTARCRPRSRYRPASFRVPALAQPRTPSMRLTSDRCTPTTAS